VRQYRMIPSVTSRSNLRPVSSGDGDTCPGVSRRGVLGMGLGVGLGIAGSVSAVEYQSYEATSGPVKALVQGLTDLSNTIGLGEAAMSGENSNTYLDSQPPQAYEPAELRDTIREDFLERNYLWTGALTASAYAPDCVFTDPTLSFKGVKTFERNLNNLSPAIDSLVNDPSIHLYSIELKEPSSQIVAEWEMDGRLRLPWKPRIKLRGQTVYTYSKERAGRIVRYDESWAVSAGQALLQLLKPSE